MRLILASIIFLGLGLIHSGCRKAEAAPAVKLRPLKASPAAVDEAEHIREFGRKLLAQLAKVNPEGNLCISPLSIQVCLTMLRQGAKGKTDEELAAALGQGKALEAAKAQKELMGQFPDLEQASILNFANGLWVKKDMSFEPEFLKALESSYGAAARKTDFPQPALQEVNAWVNEKTKGKIERIFESLDPEDVAVLANAVYFKDRWKEQFDKGRTKDGSFAVGGGSQVQVPMMRSDEVFETLYDRTGEVGAVKLPYLSGLAMICALPSEKLTAADLLDSERFGRIFGKEGWHKGESQIALPRWTFRSEEDLIPFLKSLGIVEAFLEGKADLSGMTKELPTWVTQTRHATYIAVDEEGTEAAAVTAAVETAGIPMPLIFDRPFLFAIVDPLGTPLFLGIVNDPRG